MDTLPLEILERIFQLACTDGGFTGHSLALVSKDIRAIARTARFHSIALAASPRRLQAFVALYERECDPARGDKPRIQHLHVTFPRIEAHRISSVRERSLSPPLSPLPTPSVQPQPQSYGIPADPAARAALSAAYQRVLQRRIAIERAPDPTASLEYLSAAQTLFRLVTPDLVTLVVQCGFTFGGGLCLPVIEHPFPRLREASFVGAADVRALLVEEIDLKSAPLFPALKRLSLAPAPSAYRKEVVLPFWPTHGPRVTHLAVSNAQDYLREIARAAGVQPRPEEVSLDYSHYSRRSAPSPVAAVRPLLAPVEYPSVRYLLVQPGAGPIGAHCGNSWISHDESVLVLRQVERDCRAIGLEVVEADAPKDGAYTSYYERARREWLEGIDGPGRDEAGY